MLKFEEGFSVWKMRMKIYFPVNFDVMLVIDIDFDFPKDLDGQNKSWWIKKWDKYIAYGKAKDVLVNALPTRDTQD